MTNSTRTPHRCCLALLAGACVLSSLSVPAAAQTVDLDCSATPLVEPRVTLAWPAVPAPSSVATLPATDALLILSNSSAQALDYELVGRMNAHGLRRELSLDTGTLPPHGTGTFFVPLAAMGIDISNLAFSGSLLVEARVHSTSGAFLDRSFAPQVFFHRDAAGAMKLYREQARLTQFNGGDLQGTVFTTLPRAVLGVFDGGQGEGLASEDTGPRTGRILAEPIPVGFDRWEFCLRWVYQSIDSGFGEDHYTFGTLMKGRGMRVQVDHANWPAPMLFTCSQDNGCLAFSASENTGFVVTVFAEARLGEDSDIILKAYPTESEANQFPNDPPQWVFVANPGGQARRVYYQNEASELSNLMAFGSFVFYRVDSYTQPGLAGPATLKMVTDNNDCNGGGSCQPNNFVQMEPGKTNRKFLVGHEVSHWIHRRWTGDDMGYFNDSWSANSADADCAFLGVGSHAMRSKERAAGGFIEGFAHYLTALAWNRHDQTGGIFKYYKEVADPPYDDLEADNWIVDLDGIGGNPSGGVSNWMANMCFVSDGHSVEMDWLRFFWDYRTNAGTKPSHWQVFRHIQFTRDSYPWLNSLTTYDRLLDAIGDAALGQGGLEARWISLAAANGVAQ